MHFSNLLPKCKWNQKTDDGPHDALSKFCFAVYGFTKILVPRLSYDSSDSRWEWISFPKMAEPTKDYWLHMVMFNYCHFIFRTYAIVVAN
jgi:hypothetical protein